MNAVAQIMAASFFEITVLLQMQMLIQMKAISNSNSDSNENSDENSSGTDALPYKLLSTFHTRNTHQEYFTLMATLN